MARPLSINSLQHIEPRQVAVILENSIMPMRWCSLRSSSAIVVIYTRSAALGDLLVTNLHFGRQLDRGNANPSSLGNDFGRFGFNFWAAIKARDARNIGRQARLEELNAWRNAVAHQDFSGHLSPAPPLSVTHVHRWRSACNALAISMDVIMRNQLRSLGANPPWW
jgi:hypothetical protein